MTVLIDIYLNAVTRWPDKTALSDDGIDWSYSTLHQHVLHYLSLMQHTIPKTTNGCIAIYGNKSATTVAIILAALLLGHAFMPLDLTWPAERISSALESASPLLLVKLALSPYQEAQFNQITKNCNILEINQLDTAIPTKHDKSSSGLPRPAKNAGLAMTALARIAEFDIQSTTEFPVTFAQYDPETIAYILFTSGSTGHPKGVCLSHRAAVSALTMMHEHIHFRPHDKIANQAAFCYDLAIFDLFSAFKVGASVHIIPAHVSKVPHAMIDYIVNNQLTVIYIVSSSLDYLLKYTDHLNYQLPFTTILLTGDPISTTLVSHLQKRIDHTAAIWNLYSAVEMPYAFAEPIHLTDSSIQTKTFHYIGSQITHYIEATDDSTSTHSGVLMIEGPILFSGYLNKQTTLSHIKNNPTTKYTTGDWVTLTTDSMELAGRIDRQIKLLGNRIELDDIELNLEANPLIREAIVLYHQTNKSISAYITLKDKSLDNDTIISQIKSHCQINMPFIMQPTQFHFLDTLPRTTSGKKNRKAL